MSKQPSDDPTKLGTATCGWCLAGVQRFAYCRDATSKYAARVETYTCGARRWYWWIEGDPMDMADPAHPCSVAMSKEFLSITAKVLEHVEALDRPARGAKLNA